MASLNEENTPARRTLRSAFTGGFRFPLREMDGKLEIQRIPRPELSVPQRIINPVSPVEKRLNALIDYVEQLEGSLFEGLMEE